MTYAFRNWTYDMCIWGRKITSIHCDNKRKQNHFPRIGCLEAQGTVQFMELKGQVYPALVREFYANFRYKDGKY
ncbi:hypothetical protein Lal_00043644 [Lupinus albus]|nr:hypothetical protein Lal_00043644 [Lupinus albus]